MPAPARIRKFFTAASYDFGMNLAPILHSLVWALFQNIAEVQPGQDARKSRESGTVSNGSILAHCQNFDDYDRAFAIMKEQGLLVEIPFPEELMAVSLEREFIVYKLQLEAADLEGHLKVTGVNKATVEDELIGCFLDLARKLGREPYTIDVAPIPVRKGPAIYPHHFKAAVICLGDAGYCLRSDDKMSWLPKIGPIMVAEGIWSDDRLTADIWREELCDLISMMPVELRARLEGSAGQISPFMMEYAFRHHWEPSTGWLDERRAMPLDSRQYPFSAEQLVEIAHRH